MVTLCETRHLAYGMHAEGVFLMSLEVKHLKYYYYFLLIFFKIF